MSRVSAERVWYPRECLTRPPSNSKRFVFRDEGLRKKMPTMQRIADTNMNKTLIDRHQVRTGTYSLTHSLTPGRREHTHTVVRVCIRWGRQLLPKLVTLSNTPTSCPMNLRCTVCAVYAPLMFYLRDRFGGVGDGRCRLSGDI